MPMFSRLLRNGSGPSKGPQQEAADPVGQASPDTPASDERDVPLHGPGNPDAEGSAAQGSAPENVSESGQSEAGAGEPEEHPEDKILRQPGGVDELWYKSAYPDVEAANMPAVQHYRLYGWKEGRDPNPDFSTNWYLQEYPDVAVASINPLVHFLNFGMKEGRRPQARETLLETAPWSWLAEQGAFFPKLGSIGSVDGETFGTEGRRKIVFAGHDASRTGAPLILLALIEHHARDAEEEILIFLKAGGPLLEKYREYGDVIINDGIRAAFPSVSSLLASLAYPHPTIAICNSVECWALSSAFALAKLKVISLVHENLGRYPAEPIETILASSDEIIFPALAMRDVAIEADVRFEKATVISQGLLRPDFGLRDKEQARNWLRKEIGLSDDVKIVLGCGTRILRKGFDIFHQLASSMIEAGEADLHFVWLGGSATDDPDLGFWMNVDAKAMALSGRLTVIDSVEDTEPYFLAADVFALTSRDDPFPCVVHEAMSAALPVVLFGRSGGGPEAIVGGCGIVVPYLNVGEMAKAVTRILTSADLADRMGEKARDRVRNVYRFSDYADKIRSLATGLETAVPPHISAGTRGVVMTADGAYVERAKD